MKRILPVLGFASIILLLITFSPNHTNILAGVYAQSTECSLPTIHCYRRQADYDGWGLHVWGPTHLDGEVTKPTEEIVGFAEIEEVETSYLTEEGNEADEVGSGEEKSSAVSIGDLVWLVGGSLLVAASIVGFIYLKHK
jgi:hypothetical protein